MAREGGAPQRPTDGHVHELRVLGSERLSSSFVRVRLSGDPAFDAEFQDRGYDQWFRLFLPNEHGGCALPYGTGEGWYQRWLAIAEAQRSVCRNYTVRQARRDADRWEIDVDFVVHASPSGDVDGPAAAWSLTAAPGDRVGFLDQGVLFGADSAAAAAAAGGRAWVVADETGLPGVEGILASLPPQAPITCLLEVPHDDDVRVLPVEPGQQVRWFVRGDSGDLPGQAAFRGLRESGLGPRDYLYAAGEGSMSLAARQLARAAGISDDRIDFCAYWRPERRAA